MGRRYGAEFRAVGVIPYRCGQELMAYASTKFTQWDSIGELERFEKVSAQLDTTAVDDPPETLGELFSIYRELIHAGSRSSPGRESPAEDA